MPLTVPGEFLAAPTTSADAATLLPALRKKLGGLAPTPTAHHGTAPVYVPPALQQSEFVFVRRDAHRSPLQRPYEGPYKVVEAGAKTFQLDMGGRTEVVSIDRLKPAQLDLDQPVQLALPRPRGRPRKSPSVPSSSTNFVSGGGYVAKTDRTDYVEPLTLTCA